jgi:hypothetical protein
MQLTFHVCGRVTNYSEVVISGTLVRSHTFPDVYLRIVQNIIQNGKHHSDLCTLTVNDFCADL